MCIDDEKCPECDDDAARGGAAGDVGLRDAGVAPQKRPLGQLPLHQHARPLQDVSITFAFSLCVSACSGWRAGAKGRPGIVRIQMFSAAA